MSEMGSSRTVLDLRTPREQVSLALASKRLGLGLEVVYHKHVPALCLGCCFSWWWLLLVFVGSWMCRCSSRSQHVSAPSCSSCAISGCMKMCWPVQDISQAPGHGLHSWQILRRYCVICSLNKALHTSYIGCQCLSEYRLRLHFLHFTVSGPPFPHSSNMFAYQWWVFFWSYRSLFCRTRWPGCAEISNGTLQTEFSYCSSDHLEQSSRRMCSPSIFKGWFQCSFKTDIFQ